VFFSVTKLFQNKVRGVPCFEGCMALRITPACVRLGTYGGSSGVGRSTCAHPWWLVVLGTSSSSVARGCRAERTRLCVVARCHRTPTCGA
jgi:hypothetical protein